MKARMLAVAKAEFEESISEEAWKDLYKYYQDLHEERVGTEAFDQVE